MDININNNSESADIWVDEEIQKMLSIIDEMNLSKDLSLQEFKIPAIKCISDELSMAGYYKSFEQVETVLVSLKMSYLKCKSGLSLSADNALGPYYDSLDKIWNSCSDKDSKKENGIVDENEEKANVNASELSGKISNEKSSPWSEEETVKLLNLIDSMHLIHDFRHRLSPSTIQKLVTPLLNCGYNRTCNQIIGKMRSLRGIYLRCIREGRTAQDAKNFPFFDRIDKMFRQLQTNSATSVLQPIDHDYENKFETYVDSNQSASLWQSTDSMKIDDQETSFASSVNSPSDKTTQDYATEKPEENNFDNVQIDHNQNNPIDVKNNLDINLNSSTKHTTTKFGNNANHSSSNNINVVNVNKRKSKTRSFESEIPKFIRIVKGNSKFILKKMERSPNIKFKLSPHKRHRSSNEESNYRPIKLSSSQMNELPTSFKIIESANSNHKSEPIIDVSRTPLIPTTSQTHSTNNDLVISETIKAVMKQIINHQEQMQQQHHMWMEKQFEIQRNHDRSERQLLLDEIREFRKELRDVTEQLFTD